MNLDGDKITRWTAVAAVLAVAAVAALISYNHAVTVVYAHGEPGLLGRLYPAVIDGLIVAASMVLLDAARHHESAPSLAWWMLGAGIGATLAINVLDGLPSGWLSALVAAWPAGALVGSYELLMLLVRSAARRAEAVEPPRVGQAEAVPLHAIETATAATVAQVATDLAGAVRGAVAAGLSQRQAAARFEIPRSRVAAILKDAADGGGLDAEAVA